MTNPHSEEEADSYLEEAIVGAMSGLIEPPPYPFDMSGFPAYEAAIAAYHVRLGRTAFRIAENKHKASGSAPLITAEFVLQAKVLIESPAKDNWLLWLAAPLGTLFLGGLLQQMLDLIGTRAGPTLEQSFVLLFLASVGTSLLVFGVLSQNR